MTKKITSAIDAMGGDNSPDKTIEGVFLVLKYKSKNNDFMLNLFGDVTVNKKMKEFNKISYDILLKINKSNMKSFEMNFKLISSYFMVFDGEKCPKYIEFSNYFSKFYKYCFGLPLDNMLSKLLNFKY